MSDPAITRHKAVFFTYLIVDETGDTVEQSDAPIGYVHGANSQLLDKVEQCLEGHRSGDLVEVEVAPEEGFGPYDPGLTFTDDLVNVPSELHHVGAETPMTNEAGEVKTFVVTRIADGKLTVDGNHPYAGRTMRFRVTIKEVRDATAEEIASGRPDDHTPPTVH